MNTLILICVLSCLVLVNGRHFEDRKEHEKLTDIEDQSEEFSTHREHGVEQARHRRRRWQMGYGYDYPPPLHGYYPERREYDRNPQDLTRIIKLLEEISSYIRRPQTPAPAPQPIYIPYPVPYPFPRYSPCTNQGTKKPNITTRFPDMEDTNQNWGFVLPEEEDEGDYDDGSRPITFEPMKPKRPMKRPMPKVEHGSSQAQAQASTSAPNFADDPSAFKAPNPCNAAILACCADKNQRTCFSNFGCVATFDSGNACTPESITSALESIKLAYSPVN